LPGILLGIVERGNIAMASGRSGLWPDHSSCHPLRPRQVKDL